MRHREFNHNATTFGGWPLIQLSLSRVERSGNDVVPTVNSGLEVYRRQDVRRASREITEADINLGLVRDTMWIVSWRNGRIFDRLRRSIMCSNYFCI